MSAEVVMTELKQKMDKTIEHYRDELKTIRTGRASATMLDNVRVDYYGTPTAISGVATINCPEPRQITIQPWETKMINEIEKAIMNSGLGLNPSNDGRIIRINIPQLTEERRKEMVKMTKKMAEETKVALRNERRDANERLKKMEKDKAITEDDVKKYQDKVQEATDNFVKKVDEITAAKEKEVMEI